MMEFFDFDVISAILGGVAGIAGTMLIFLPKNSNLREMFEAAEAMATNYRNKLILERGLTEGLAQELAAVTPTKKTTTKKK